MYKPGETNPCPAAEEEIEKCKHYGGIRVDKVLSGTKHDNRLLTLGFFPSI
jgi:hypothetical protein